MLKVFKELTIVIVCYDSSTLIKKNLSKIINFKTVIIDNSNCKKTFNLIKKFPNIRYFAPKQNLGYGSGNNLGVSLSSTTYILILNPDILIDIDSIKILYESFFKYKDAGILAPALYDEKSIRKSNGSVSYLKRNLFFKNHSKYFNKQADGDTCYDYVIGAALLFKKKFFEQIGGFDQNFFMYFEDNDICDRVYKNRKSVIEIPSSKMIHLQGKSSDINNLKKNIKLSIVHKVSEFIYYKKNYSFFKLYVIFFILFFDYLQRFFFNILIFKFKNSFKNFIRLLSMFLFITSLYRIFF